MVLESSAASARLRLLATSDLFQIARSTRLHKLFLVPRSPGINPMHGIESRLTLEEGLKPAGVQ